MKNNDLKDKLKKILELFLCFLKIGAFTFGGGYAMVSLVQRDMVDKKKWLTDKEMVDVIAIAESTPGVIALNTATYVGAKIAGFWGALFASLGAILPSVAIILIIYPVLQLFGENQYVKWAFLGIRAAVAALILNATYKISKLNEKNIVSLIVTGVALTLALLSTFNVVKIDMIFIILGAAVFGIIWGIIGRRKKAKQQTASEPIPADIATEDNDNAANVGVANPKEDNAADQNDTPTADDNSVIPSDDATEDKGGEE